MRSAFRFAPSPNGRLHLGHAYSALMNERAARNADGALRLRIEDTDPTRSRREYEDAIIADLAWLGVAFDGAARRQSDHLSDYAEAFDRLARYGLVYPCLCTRGEILTVAAGERDPDGAPLHLGRCRAHSGAETRERVAAGERAAWRVDVRAALELHREPLGWSEHGEGDAPRAIHATPLVWGDFAIRGKERAATYHLAVVVDDAIQHITDVVRGRDILPATSIHVLLQTLFGLPTPRYRHHRLVLDAAGLKMSKSAASQPIAALRQLGFTPKDLRAALGFADAPQTRLTATLS